MIGRKREIQVMEHRSLVLAEAGYWRKYRIVDPFLDFALRFLDGDRPDSRVVRAGSPAHVAWGGDAFELACLAHTPQIKSALAFRVLKQLVPRGATLPRVVGRRSTWS